MTMQDKQRILVVDDEPFNLEIIAEYLADAGDFDLAFAEDGEAAWDVLNGPGSFELVILDRMMPRLDGLSLLKRMKADGRFGGTPVIMQTAAASADQVREGLAAGAHYYLTKPFEPDALVSIVKAAVDEQRQRRELAGRLDEQQQALRLIDEAAFSVATPAEARTLVAFLASLCPTPDLAAMGLSELLANGIEHGNLGVSYAEKTRLKLSDGWDAEIGRRLALPENRGKRVRVHLMRQPWELVFTVTDEGAGFDWARYLDFDPERAFDPNGRGIALARQLAFSRLEYRGRGNEVVAVVALPDPAAAAEAAASAAADSPA